MPNVVEQYFIEEFAKLALEPMDLLDMKRSRDSGYRSVDHGSSKSIERLDPSAARHRAALKDDLKSEKLFLLQRYFQEEFAKLASAAGQPAHEVDGNKIRTVGSAARSHAPSSNSRGVVNTPSNSSQTPSTSSDTTRGDNSYLLWTSEAYLVVDRTHFSRTIPSI